MKNYWADKISFTERMQKELVPVLSYYNGRSFTTSLFDEMQDVIVDWMSKLLQPLFSIDLIIVRTYDGYEEVVKSFKLEVLYQ